MELASTVVLSPSEHQIENHRAIAQMESIIARPCYYV